jgi:hypothetical protein
MKPTGRSNLVDVADCTVLAFTDLAVKIEHGSGECWLPKRACQLDPEDADIGDEVTVTLPEPLATEKVFV